MGTSHNRRSAIHVALEHGASLEAIQLLLDQGPDTTTFTNNAGETPLRVVSCRDAFFLMKHYPELVVKIKSK
jgi:hypothetical protein